MHVNVHDPALLVDVDRDATGTRVPDGVVDGLLDDAVDRGLELGDAALAAELHVGGHGDSLALGDARGKPLDRGLDAKLVERGGTQTADQPAERLDLRLDTQGGLADSGAQAV